MRVILITPYAYQNQGVRLLAAVLRRAGHDAQILLLKRWGNNNVKEPTAAEWELLEQHVAEARPDLIGMSLGSPYLPVGIELAQRLRRVSKAHLVWGGVHPTISPEDCIPHADSVCVGEGEGPLADLADALAGGRPIVEIPNLWVRNGPEIRRNPLRQLVTDLDSLPYDQQFDGPVTVIEQNRLRHGDPYLDSAIYRAFASRGCPFQCAYCYNNQYRRLYQGLGRYHRIREVGRVLDELVYVRRRFRALRRVHFDDDSFVFPPRWIEEFAQKYPARVGLPFSLLLNPEAVDDEGLRRLRAAGLMHVQVGIQSASPTELAEDFARRGSNESVIRLAQKLLDLGIEATYDIILDNPLAGRENHRAMLDLLLAMPRPFNLFLYSLTFFPKAEITEKLLAMGRITPDDVEGRATKSWRQFRFTFDYPRPPEDRFWAALISLTSKRFLPRGLIRTLSHSAWLARHPAPLRVLAEAANAIKLVGVATKMWRRGELSVFKLREYAHLRGRLIQ